MTETNWIVMPCHNAIGLTKNAIESCLGQDVPVKVLGCDDASTDGTAQYLHSLHPEVQAFHFTSPKGVSRMWNVALTYLFDGHKSPYALVVNTDVVLRTDTYRRLIEDGGQFVTCVGTSSGAQFPGGEPTGSRRPHPDFSCFLIRRTCWEKVGRFDERMAIYCSDGDYHLRMHNAGIEAYCLDVPFFHVASGTLKNAEPMERERIQRRAEQDRAAFKDKWNCEMGSDQYYSLFGASHVKA